MSLVERVTAAIEQASRDVQTAYVVRTFAGARHIYRGDKLIFKSRDLEEISRKLHSLTSEFYARAAIEAMREPTEEMVEEIRKAMSPEKFVSHMRAMDCWDAGISAALGQEWDAGDKLVRAALTPGAG